MPSSPIDQATRVVLERGVELRRSPGGAWHTTTEPDGDSVNLAHLMEQHGLRPVLADLVIHGELTHTFLLPLTGRLLEVEWSELSNRRLERRLFAPHQNLCYVLAAALYHCLRLAEVYAGTIHEKLGRLSGDVPSLSGPVVLSGTLEPYFKFDTLMATVRRIYDTSRYLLWPVFGGGGSQPANFPATLRKCTFPHERGEFRGRLETSWAERGERVTAYRDCIMHYVPLQRSLPWALLESLESGVWAMRVPIPDNPDARSHSVFEYSRGLDALTFGWESTCEAVTIVKDILDTLSLG